MDLPGLLFETRPSLDALRARLASSHPLDVHATVLHLRQRFEQGQDDVHALATLVPASEWRRFPPEAQRELARWAVSGLPVQVPPPPEGLPLLVRLDWTRVALLGQPTLLEPLDGTALGNEAVRELPPERVLSSGLLERLLQARSPGMQRTALEYVRACVERALLAPAVAQARLLELASRAKPALAAEGLELLACPWALALPCPPLKDFLAHGDEPAVAAVHVLRSRRAVDVLRQLALDEQLGPRIHREALLALGDTGSRDEVRPILERALADPARFGREALRALACLRRRGISPSPEETYSVLELYLENPAVEPPLAAEVLSSRAETVLAALEGARADRSRSTPSRSCSLPARQHAPACQRQAGTRTAMPLRGARCAGAGAAVTSGVRPHRLSDEAPAAGRHHAPPLHRVGVAASPGVPGASASGKPHEVPRRLRSSLEIAAISVPPSRRGGGERGT